MMGIVQTNIAVIGTKKISVIEKALTLDIFFRIIYIMVPKLLVTMLITILILDLGVTRYISSDWTRFSNLIDYKNFCCTKNEE